MMFGKGLMVKFELGVAGFHTNVDSVQNNQISIRVELEVKIVLS